MSEVELFSYDVLAPEVRGLVEEHTGEIRRLARRSAEDIVEIGERLMEVKAALQHGDFGDWVKAEFGWSYEAAKKFMQVARQFKTVNFTDLQIAPSALYALASGSTPDFIREEVIGMAQATGQPVTNKLVQARLEAHRSPLPPLPEEEPEEVVTHPEPAPMSEAVDNAAMPKKKSGKPVKASEPYVPLPEELEERELEDGTFVMVPKLPDTPKKLEIKQKDWEKATRRFSNTAHTVLVGLGQLEGYALPDLKEMMESPEGRREGVGVQLRLLQERLSELLEKWEGMGTSPRTVDAEPLLQALPPEKESKTLDLN